jgi:hypothetical protein
MIKFASFYRARQSIFVQRSSSVRGKDMNSEGRLTGRLVAAGRALVGISQNELATAANISFEALRLLEANAAAWISNIESQALERALEQYGAVIVVEGDGMGAGVRLKFTRQDTRQIGRLETDGGISRLDDVP